HGGLRERAWGGHVGPLECPDGPPGSPTLKILHLFANWKWTGPADPALSLAAWQAAADAPRGPHELLFLSGTGPEGQASRIQPQVDARGVRSLPGFHLSKHARWR